MIQVGARVIFYTKPLGEGQVLAVNVLTVPIGDGRTYTFDEPRYAILADSGQMVYPKMNDDSVLEIK